MLLPSHADILLSLACAVKSVPPDEGLHMAHGYPTELLQR